MQPVLDLTVNNLSCIDTAEFSYTADCVIVHLAPLLSHSVIPGHLTMHHEVSIQDNLYCGIKMNNRSHTPVDSQLLCVILTQYFGLPLSYSNPKLLLYGWTSWPW